MMKNKYAAIFKKENLGYSVRFPKVNNCFAFTEGDTFEDAYSNAVDALQLLLEVSDCNEIDYKSLELEKNEFIVLIDRDIELKEVKTFRELTQEQRMRAFSAYQELAEQDENIVPFESFEEYCNEQCSLNMDFNTRTFECLG